MSAEILFCISFVLLCIGWFFWLQQQRSLRLAPWRNILAWLGIIGLTVSVLLFALFLFLTHRAEITNEPFNSRLITLLPIARMGFWTATGAVVICWFATDKSRVFFLISSLVIWILWVAQAMGV